jgi:hypothetical protein
MPRWQIKQYARPDYLPETCRKLWQLQTEELLARRQNSDIYHCDASGASWIVKRCFEPGTNLVSESTAQAEYAALERLYNSAIAVYREAISPRPLGYIKELGVVAMSWERGQPMTQLILRFLGTTDSAENYGRMAGGWLERFHRLHVLPVGKNDFEQKLEYLQGHIVTKQLSGDPLLKQVVIALKERVSEASSVYMPYSWIHSDFKTDNLLVDGSRVIGLDPSLQHENSVIFDIVPFLIHLDLLRWHPRGMLFKNKLAALETGFMSGYRTITQDWKLPIAWLKCEMLSQSYTRLLIRDGANLGFKGKVFRKSLGYSLSALIA